MGKLINSHLPCADCGSSDALAEYENSTYCFSCQSYTRLDKKPSFFTFDNTKSKKKIEQIAESEIPNEIYIKYLGKYGITKKLVEKYKLKFYNYYWDGIVGFKNRLIFPIMHKGEEIGFQARSTKDGEDPKYYTVGDKSKLFWTEPNDNKEIVIVEDMISAIKVGTIKPAVALLGTSLNNNQLLTLLQNYDKIYIWLDGDKPGKKSSEKLKNRLTLYNSHISVIETKEDPKCVFFKEIRQLLESC